MATNNAGAIHSIQCLENEHGQTVMRVTVDFYDGAAPDIDFKTVWNLTPVTIVEIKEP